MATIHRTTLTPGKLELLAAWLPTRPWYRGSGTPLLSRAGGFRLDDPDGEVGIELTQVRDEQGDRPVTYLVPMTFRGAPLDGARQALIGTSEHGVLGPRWIYDGPADPIFTAQLGALLRGTVVPQAQNMSDTVDAAVTVEPTPIADLLLSGPARDEGGATVLPVRVAGAAGLLHVHRVLQAGPVSGTRVLAPVYATVDADGRAIGGAVRMPVISLR